MHARFDVSYSFLVVVQVHIDTWSWCLTYLDLPGARLSRNGFLTCG